MIAPKRAVMIDDPTPAITVPADRSPDAPLTCSTCRITYLPSALPPASTPSEDWVCDRCHPTLG
jgi:hypothetical protein